MLKKSCFVVVFLLSACVTVNIYFPAAAVERAAEQIVKETWGSGLTEPDKKGQPQSRIFKPEVATVMFLYVNEAQAQEADINVSNPAIRALKDSIKNRSELLKPYMDRGNVGITRDGLLAVRAADGLSLKERAESSSLRMRKTVTAKRSISKSPRPITLPRNPCPRSRRFSPKAGSNRQGRAGGSKTRRETGEENSRKVAQPGWCCCAPVPDVPIVQAVQSLSLILPRVETLSQCHSEAQPKNLVFVTP